MKMLIANIWMRTIALYIALLLCSTVPIVPAQAAAYKIGILAAQPDQLTRQRWKPLANYLNRKIPEHHFEVYALNFTALDHAIKHRNIDFILTNPAHHIVSQANHKLSEAMLTIGSLIEGKSYFNFGGVIFSRADRADIKTLSTLQELKVAVVSKDSLGGYLMQAYELQKQNITLNPANIIETEMPHDNVVHTVLADIADIGFVRTGVLERMIHSGQIQQTDIKVIHSQNNDNFPLMLSTQIYPEWPFSALADTPNEVSRAITAALLAITHGSPITTKMKIHGFVTPANYDSVETVLKTLMIAPYNHVPSYIWTNIWRQERLPIIAFSTAIIIIIFLLLKLIFTNQKLTRSQRLIAAQENELKLMLSAISEGVYCIDQSGICSYINEPALQMLGYEKDDVLGENAHLLFHVHKEPDKAASYNLCPAFQALSSGEIIRSEEVFRTKGGHHLPVLMSAARIARDNTEHWAEIVFSDMSQQKKREASLHTLATVDSLTGLPNRHTLADVFELEIARFQRRKSPVVILMFDIDHFKAVNDTHGHAAGDSALISMANVVKQELRKGDYIWRFGGEEFLMLLPDTGLDAARHYAERLREHIASTVIIHENISFSITISIGMTELTHADTSNQELIISRADEALYQAKENGRNQVWPPESQ